MLSLWTGGSKVRALSSGTTTLSTREVSRMVSPMAKAQCVSQRAKLCMASGKMGRI